MCCFDTPVLFETTKLVQSSMSNNFFLTAKRPSLTAHCRRFSRCFEDPLKVLESCFRSSSPLACLTHGDSWHNNFLFNKTRQGLKLTMVDWQASATRLFRQQKVANLCKSCRKRCCHFGRFDLVQQLCPKASASDSKKHPTEAYLK